MIVVGTNSFGYNHWRNFAGLPFEDVRFKKVLDWYKLPAHFFFKTQNRVIQKYINRFNDFGLNTVDIYHFFNTLTPVKKPWVVTFETSLPRLDPNFKAGYRWMADDFCKRIIGYTQRALDIQSVRLQNYPDFEEQIKKKMMLLYPAQRKMVDNLEDKDFGGDIVFTITGSVFFLKGGWELLLAFERFAREGFPVKLNVISRLEVAGYKDNHATPSLVDKAKKILMTNPLITHYHGLPNSQVIEILKKSHIGILPSYGETFGYSLLEAMACGCAVISTSVPPFPEFVKEDWGWLIDIPVINRDGIMITDTDNPLVFPQLSEQLAEGIYKTVASFINDRNLIERKAQNALKRIDQFHNPADRVQILNTIYRNALTT